MKFLAVTDLHYSLRDVPEAERRNILSADKLRAVIAELAPGCGFIADLGDTADAGFGDQRELMSAISGILKGSGLPVYSLIGNHDTSLPKEEICRIMGMPGRYYSVDTPEFLLLFLDANMNSPDAPFPESEIEWSRTYIDPEQLSFIKSALDKSEKPVLVFCHELFVLSDPDAQAHVILNARDAMDIFENSGKVRAVFCGHYHYGDLSVVNGIPYIAFSALCLHEDRTCAVVTIGADGVSVSGYGLQKSFTFPFEH